MSTMTEGERRRKFFYAEHEAGLYNVTIDLVAPEYRLMHGTLRRLMRENLLPLGGDRAEAVRGAVLDLGCGTGAESIPILEEFPNVRILALDLCEPMRREFMKAFQASPVLRAQHFDDRVKFIVGDILDKVGQPENLRAHAAEITGDKDTFIGAISAFTIHHLHLRDKFEVYRRIFEVLASGAIFINGDLFNFDSAELSRQAEKYDIEFIVKNFRRLIEITPPTDSELRNHYARLCTGWVEHYHQDNYLDPVQDQAEMMRLVGFRETGVPFRFWQVGVLWGLKD